MTKRRELLTFGLTAVFALAAGLSGAGTTEPGYGKEGYGRHGAMGSHGMGMMHNSAGHLIRHLLKHEKEIGLTGEQVAKLKDIQLNLDKTRIKSEADIQVAERELKALTEDEKADLSAIEAKLKQSEDLQVALRMTSIKTRRDVLALLTPEQRAKEKAEHEKMMQQHKEGGKGHGSPHGGAMMNPHGSMSGSPHQGMPSQPGK
ncbi:MAG TPA: Spy/CpxP family protein refolding chaperone [Nitrospira sp.]|nr:Spy/CpxP family protein refolding chaperone [Nitrospira sp.]